MRFYGKVSLIFHWNLSLGRKKTKIKESFVTVLLSGVSTWACNPTATEVFCWGSLSRYYYPNWATFMLTRTIKTLHVRISFALETIWFLSPPLVCLRKLIFSFFYSEYFHAIISLKVPWNTRESSTASMRFQNKSAITESFCSSF